jgi:pilus assembly protein FimV
MKLSQKFNLSVLGLALACATSGSAALTLGRASGAAILGRPLEVTVSVQVASEEESGGMCFEADVFYGDSRQDSSRVTVTSDAPSQGLPVKVRVSSYAPVDEPIVTIYLRAACGRQATRRYVLLADLVSDLTASVVPMQLPVTRPATTTTAIAVTPSASPTRNPAPAIAAVGPGVSREKPLAAASASVEKPIRRPRAEREAPRASVAAKAVLEPVVSTSRRARLKLAPIDLTQDRDPTLRISNELPFLPLEDLKKRSEAIAMWRSLNASPEDILRDGLRMQSMETDLKALQDVTQKNRQVMLDLAVRLDRAESQRYANPLVYGLIGLLLACGAGLAYGFFRFRAARLGPSPWWRGPNADEKLGDANAAGIDGGAFVASDSKLATHPSAIAEPTPSEGLYEIDIDLPLDGGAFTDLGQPLPAAVADVSKQVTQVRATAGSSHADFSQSVFGSFREISTEEMLDVRQQADFFMTLGQYDEAIEVLESRIKSGDEANPLVYLDLLKVFHTLSKKAEYDTYRKQFNEFFSGNVPAYAQFNHQGGNLDAYPSICNRIVELWPSLEAVEYIEKCLIRSPEGDLSSGFDLDAFRDLLMLHGVVRRLVSSSDSGRMPFSAVRTSPSSIENSFNPPLPTISLATNVVLPPVGMLDSPLDFDLSEPSNNLIEFDGVSFIAPPSHK